ncbi:MAG: hypothetical protein IJ372_14000 [Rhodococcus sp.]|nr:hypothetical protein [Rhodococcus sp. (in: high G+C Gram-positive bacteria)]
MSIVAHSRPFVIGVDTHARKHSYAILTPATGALIATNEFFVLEFFELFGVVGFHPAVLLAPVVKRRSGRPRWN